jgi:DNA mismatch repair protein MutL
VTPAAAPIRRLRPATIERIAAGEVVDRPASVVKELVENSIDAGARGITVRLEGGGLRRIEVADDGQGIPAGALELALERHATSKLDPDGPIERIATLGFRGEALASIGAVARLRLLSRPPDQDVAEGVDVAGSTPAGHVAEPRAPGTTVAVDDLFFNTPARRKFLHAPAAEQLEIVRTVERLYLARPEVGVRLEAEGREIGVYPAAPNLRDAAARVLGPEFLTASFPVSGSMPGGRVSGYLSHPELSASSGSSLYLSVNGRSVASRALAAAVRAAYSDTLPRARFPMGVLHLEIDLERVDVNVHPTKREVRFERERELVDALRRSVREALLAEPRVAGAPPAISDRAPPYPGLQGAPAPPPGPDRRPDRGGRVVPLVGPSAPVTVGAGPGRPPLELLGSLDRLYWVAASVAGLVLVDQHAASERLLYDALRRTGSLARQSLVDPVVLPLSGGQRAALSAHTEAVRRAGFETEPFGPATVRVVSVPAYRGRLVRAEALRELLDELAAGGRPTVPDGLEERTAASIACHAAIRAGDAVERDEIARLLAALEAIPGTARTCPHGRPILVQIDRARLDRWFLRSGG